MLKHSSSGAVSKPLLFGTATTFLAALFIVLAFILPAEYGKDPTGLGEKLGVNKMSLAPAAETDSGGVASQANMPPPDKEGFEGSAHSSYQTPLQFMQTEVVIAGDGSVEYKFDLKAGNTINYVWSVSNGGLAYADLHGHTPGPSGEPEDEILVQYLDTQEASMVSGVFTAPFDGEHGWYFLSLEPGEITITIQASGHWDSHGLLPIE